MDWKAEAQRLRGVLKRIARDSNDWEGDEQDELAFCKEQAEGALRANP